MISKFSFGHTGRYVWLSLGGRRRLEKPMMLGSDRDGKIREAVCFDKKDETKRELRAIYWSDGDIFCQKRNIPHFI